MQSFIVISRNTEEAILHSKNFCRSHDIYPLDVTIFTKNHDTEKSTGDKQNIGIADIKELQRTLFLTPTKGKEKAIIIVHADTLTREAQNAMLKVLEEPPAHTLLFLIAPSKDVFLPTVLSRCSIINLENDIEHIAKEEKDAIFSDFTLAIQQRSTGFAKAEKLSKQKGEAVNWTSDLLTVLREKLLENVQVNSDLSQQQYFISTIKLLQDLQKVLTTTNTNTRLALENFFLAIEKRERNIYA